MIEITGKVTDKKTLTGNLDRAYQYITDAMSANVDAPYFSEREYDDLRDMRFKLEIIVDRLRGLCET
ncbi:MAG: hypothetical protein RR351_04605 [Christensenella sp.]